MEGVEGAVMTFATKCLLEEILGEILRVNLHIDNRAAISLMTDCGWKLEDKAPTSTSKLDKAEDPRRRYDYLS